MLFNAGILGGSLFGYFNLLVCILCCCFRQLLFDALVQSHKHVQFYGHTRWCMNERQRTYIYVGGKKTYVFVYL